ncbi:MAG: RNA methyltransferase [Flavobacteriaceae bacterium]|nr:RNA methyltransferase [Flavobacteriales bacterium]RCL70182.1 MAG: TrmH family RNA methyltransferase [Bacteroidota bacterium]|tara:strand:- start:18172 stop:18717 length:546 start_codon:yes stop_codon:yes gene_type:complete
MKKLKNSELSRLSIDEFKNSSKTPVIVILDNIRSAHNVGSVFRTCDAFLIDKIILCGITAIPPNKEIRKTALGSSESVDWRYYKNTEEVIMKLKKKDYQIIAVEQANKSIKLESFRPENEKKYAIIFGNEIKGISQKIIDNSDSVIEIPQFGTKHSLNVSVSAGIVIWDIFSKISLNQFDL